MAVQTLPTRPEARVKRAAPKTNVLKAPAVAWPTFVLAAGAVGLWAVMGALFLTGALPWWVTLPIASAAAFACFTPMHDASHKSITRQGLPNEVIGRLCALPLLAPFAAFRFLHLQHHRHTNHDHEDPDMWSGRGPWFILPLRWLTQDFHYYAFYAARWSSRPKRERRETAAMLGAYVALACALVVAGYGWEALIVWLIPGRIGIGLLAYGFDYLPHKPHHVRGKDDRFKATVLRPSPWLTPVLLYQNFHLIHHLYPGVPFYRYASVWRERKARIVAKGAEGRDLLGRPIPTQDLLES